MELVQFAHRIKVDEMNALLDACHGATERLAGANTVASAAAEEALATTRTYLWLNVGDYADVVALTDAATEAPLDPLSYGARGDAVLAKWRDIEVNTEYLDSEASKVEDVVSENGGEDEELESLYREFARTTSAWIEYVHSFRSADVEYDYDEYERWWNSQH